MILRLVLFLQAAVLRVTDFYSILVVSISSESKLYVFDQQDLLS